MEIESDWKIKERALMKTITHLKKQLEGHKLRQEEEREQQKEASKKDLEKLFLDCINQVKQEKEASRISSMPSIKGAETRNQNLAVF